MVEKLRESRIFLEECWEELEKVTWPDREQLQSATIVIILFNILVAMIIWGMDAVVRTLVDFILGIFGA